MPSFPPPDNLDLLPGMPVGNYVVEALVGRGTQGSVYLARDSLLGRYVALKTLRGSEGDDTRGVEEARMLASLEHPNLVRVYHATRQQGVWFIVSEYLDGGSLQDLLNREGKLALCQALDLVAQAARGLSYVHARGILHRDVKPQNMLLSRLGEVKLADFGLAQAIASQRSQVSANVGTPAFRAPEVCADGLATPASDVFGLGASLFFLLTGRMAFLNEPAIGASETDRGPRFPSELPAPVRSLISAMLSTSPSKRPSSATLPALLARLAQDPDQVVEIDCRQAFDAASPITEAGTGRHQREALRRGRAGADVAELVGAIASRAHGVLLSAPRIDDAGLLLDVAREQLGPRYRLLLRDLLTPHSKLRPQCARRLGIEPNVSLEVLARRLQPPTPAGTDEVRVLELHAPRGLIRSQLEELSELALAVHARGVTCVLTMPEGELPEQVDSEESPLPGFVHVAAWPGGETREELERRLQVWLELASDGGKRFSRDGLSFAALLCAREGHHWAKLAYRSLLVATAARMPFVTSWSVLGASTLPPGFESIEQLPAALRNSPSTWPIAEFSARLASLRESAAAEAGLAQEISNAPSIASSSGQPSISRFSERTPSNVLDHQ